MDGSIVCGIDDSETARRAARVARRLSRELEVDLIFVRVIEDGSPDAGLNATARRLERMRAIVSEVDCGARWLVGAGRPADVLVAAATASAASLIVVGAEGTNPSPLDSICVEVSRGAPCPVLVVPPGGSDPPLILPPAPARRPPIAEPRMSTRDDRDAACEPLLRWEWEGGASAPTDS